MTNNTKETNKKLLFTDVSDSNNRVSVNIPSKSNTSSKIKPLKKTGKLIRVINTFKYSLIDIIRTKKTKAFVSFSGSYIRESDKQYVNDLDIQVRIKNKYISSVREIIQCIAVFLIEHKKLVYIQFKDFLGNKRFINPSLSEISDYMYKTPSLTQFGNESILDINIYGFKIILQIDSQYLLMDIAIRTSGDKRNIESIPKHLNYQNFNKYFNKKEHYKYVKRLKSYFMVIAKNVEEPLKSVCLEIANIIDKSRKKKEKQVSILHQQIAIALIQNKPEDSDEYKKKLNNLFESEAKTICKIIQNNKSIINEMLNTSE